MPYFDRIDVSEDIHVTKTSASKVFYYLPLLVFFRQKV